MSYSYDESYEVYNERVRRAAKGHKCSACGDTIAKGHRYHAVSWVYDGSADSVRRCLRCQRIHEHLRGLAPGEIWPAERLDCGERYEDEWGECPPEIAALAFETGATLQEKP